MDNPHPSSFIIDKEKVQRLDGNGSNFRLKVQSTPYMKVMDLVGQKGTNGIQLSASDMMFSANGLRPDIVINPNAIPSRMTTGQLIECLVGKVAALEGQEIDGTAFTEFDIDDIKERLKSFGYEENGYEYMYNGMTGRKMKNMIFIGPTYYQRLKHMVADKLHSRARGPQTILTRRNSCLCIC